MSPEEIKALQEENAKMKADLARSQQLTKSLQEEITEQERATAPAAQAATVSLLPANPVTVGKKKYEIIYPKFIYQNKEYTAHQLAKDEALLKELLGIGFGGLVEVS